jgi:hypothetical protein
MLFGNRLRRWVDDTLTTTEFTAFFHQLRERVRELQTFESVQTLLSALQRNGATAAEKDNFLLALIREYQTRPDVNLNALFLAIFRPVLARLYGSMVKGTVDGDGLWNDLTWALLSEVSEYPIERRPDKVPANVGFGVLKRLSRWSEREAWYILFQSDPDEPDRTEFDYNGLLGGAFEHPNELFAGRGDPDTPPDPDDTDRMEQLLRAFLRRGVITVDAFYILVGTRVCGQSVKEYAAQKSLSYPATRKRRSRAEKAIRDCLAGLSPDSDVPFSDLIGLLSLGGTESLPGGVNDDEDE